MREGTGAPLKPEVGLSGKIVDLLSQPAVSQALMRLRDMFHDDLLIRTRNGYEPMPKGQRLLHELRQFSVS